MTAGRRLVRDPNPRPVQLTAYWARVAWLLILGAAGVLEVYGVWFRKAPHDTLSETTRWLWRTDTTAGAWAFRSFWFLFGVVWFPAHIVKLFKQRGTR